MNWLDVVLLIIIAGSVAASFRKGLLREIIGLISVVSALILGAWFYGMAGAFLIPYVSSRSVANFCGYVLVFLGVLLAGSLVSALAGRVLTVSGLSWIDHLLGAAFGAIRGLLIAVALVMAMMAFSPGGQPPASVVRSRVAPYVVDAARLCSAMAPYELRQGFRHTYGQVKSAWAEAVRKGIRGIPGTEKTQHDEREI